MAADQKKVWTFAFGGLATIRFGCTDDDVELVGDRTLRIRVSYAIPISAKNAAEAGICAYTDADVLLADAAYKSDVIAEKKLELKRQTDHHYRNTAGFKPCTVRVERIEVTEIISLVPVP